MKISVTCYVVSTSLAGVMESINNEQINRGATDWLGPGYQTVITSFFLGYLTTNIISGILVTQLNSKNMILGSMICNSFITLLTPLLIKYGYWSGFCLSRLLVGFSSGFIYPSIFDMLANWCPTDELIPTGNIIFSGHYLGNIISTGVAITIGVKEDWPNVFYFSGLLFLFSAFLWYFWGAENPYVCTYITLEEQEYLRESLTNITVTKNKNIPWKKIFTNTFFLCTMIAHSANSWCFWFLVFEIPVYLKDALFISTYESKILAILPYATTYLISFLTAYALDLFIEGNIISILNSRRMCNAISLWGTVFSFSAMSVTVTSFSSISMYALAVVLNYYSFYGPIINYIDLSPNFCGLLIGISNCLGNIPPCLGYVLVSTLVEDTSVMENWHPAFIMTAGAAFIGGLFFLGGGTNKVQDFNTIEPAKKRRPTFWSSLGSRADESGTASPGSKSTSVKGQMKDSSEPKADYKKGLSMASIASIVNIARKWRSRIQSTDHTEEQERTRATTSASRAIVIPIIHETITHASMMGSRHKLDRVLSIGSSKFWPGLGPCTSNASLSRVPRTASFDNLDTTSGSDFEMEQREEPAPKERSTPTRPTRRITTPIDMRRKKNPIKKKLRR